MRVFIIVNQYVVTLPSRHRKVACNGTAVSLVSALLCGLNLYIIKVRVTLPMEPDRGHADEWLTCYWQCSYLSNIRHSIDCTLNLLPYHRVRECSMLLVQ